MPVSKRHNYDMLEGFNYVLNYYPNINRLAKHLNILGKQLTKLKKQIQKTTISLVDTKNYTHTYTLRLRLFFTSFYVCDETNTVKCLITNQTMFCNARSTKKLTVKRSFYEAIFICFFN